MESTPFRYMAILTAGFTFPPLTFPIKKITPARVRPITSQLPVKKMEVKSKKVPANSAPSERSFIYYHIALKN